MRDVKKYSPAEISEIWRMYLTTGDVPDIARVAWYRRNPFRALYVHLPDDPRCRICRLPFKGIGGAVMQHVLGLGPSRLNPQVCNQCDLFLQRFQGGAEVELSILFADVRGSTTLAENMKPTEFSRLINRFYNTATKILYHRQAMVEKLIGDAVTAFFTTGFSGQHHARVAVDAARQIIEATGRHRDTGSWISIGIGVHTGLAYVGTVNSESEERDIAVFGDTANIGARLASLAGPGEIFVSQEAAQAAGLDPTGVEIRRQQVKGRTEPIDIWALN
jgi:adenylate cyclase